MAFADLVSELTGRLPGLTPFLAETFVNRAWASIRNRRSWGFLLRDAVINCPTQITTGTFNITQYSATAVGNQAARDALLAVYGTTTPSGKVLALTSVQIRFMGLGQTSQIYNITNVVDGVTSITLTLERPVQEPTNTGSQYMVYRVYVTPPTTDFVRFTSLDDMVYGIRIIGDRLRKTSVYFDARDPQRQALGQGLFCGIYKADWVTANNLGPVYEIWPGCTQGQSFYTKYQARGTDFSLPTDTQPAIIPDQLIIELALLQHGYPHAQANMANFPSFKNASWPALINESRALVYGRPGSNERGLLRDALLQDDEQNLQQMIAPGHGLRPQLTEVGIADANYWQQHPIFW